VTDAEKVKDFYSPDFVGIGWKGPKDMSGYGKFCVIEDPAGAVCTLFEPL
jgi:predicted enzyme related to lactoylglutathione lyase